MGLVETVEHLSTVQDKVYDEPTVLVVHNVTGGMPEYLKTIQHTSHALAARFARNEPSAAITALTTKAVGCE